MQVIAVSQRGEVRILLHEYALFLQQIVRKIFGKTAFFLLWVLSFLAHQDLLEFFREDVQVPGKEGKEVRVVEIYVVVESIVVIGRWHVDVHRKGQILPQHLNRLGFIDGEVLLSLGDSLSL